MSSYATIGVEAMDAQVFPETTWDVEGLVPNSTLVLAAGRAKSGKSILMLDLGISVALGEPFLDRSTRQTSVLYVPMEDHFGIVRDRLRTRLGAERNVPFHILPADGSFDQSLRLDDDGTTLMRLVATIDALDVGIVILDPLRELHTGKENDSDHMAIIMRPLRQLAHAKGVTILMTHHRNKYGTDPSSAVRGSTAITGSVDQVITLSVNGGDDDDDDDPDFTPARTMTLMSEGRYGPRQRMTARLGTGLRWELTKPQAIDASLIRRIPNLLSTGAALDVDAITMQLAAHKNRVQIALRALVKAGTIARFGNGVRGAPLRYVLADDGEVDTNGYESGYESKNGRAPWPV